MFAGCQKLHEKIKKQYETWMGRNAFLFGTKLVFCMFLTWKITPFCECEMVLCHALGAKSGVILHHWLIKSLSQPSPPQINFHLISSVQWRVNENKPAATACEKNDTNLIHASQSGVLRVCIRQRANEWERVLKAMCLCVIHTQRACKKCDCETHHRARHSR
jgi:hypothetical protein